MKLLNKDQNYEWKYCSLGGAVRVYLQSGEDIAHLEELDRKMWTALSAPVKNLEFDANTLALLDSDGDGHIRVDEIVSSAKWLCSALKDKDMILKGADSLALDAFAQEGLGAELKECATKMLESLGRGDAQSVAMSDIMAFEAGIAQRSAALRDEALSAAALSSPYGQNTEAAAAACAAVREKISDYFVRCRLAAFNQDSLAVLDTTSEKIASASAAILTTSNADIASCPIAHPAKEALLPLKEGINPAWQSAFSTVKSLVLDVDYPDADSITEQQWNDVLAKIDSFVAEKSALESSSAGVLDSNLAAEQAMVAPIRKFMYLLRDFYKILCNYVSFNNLYTDLESSIISAGRLYIDQRCCKLCIKVEDMGKQGDVASLGGMFIIYCDCESKVKGKTMKIAALLTAGDVRNIRVGKNAVFYDRDGQDWEAVVTKIVDNPINIRQAFWSPYRKFASWIGSQIDKLAAEKESSSFDNLKNSAQQSVETAKAEPVSPSESAKKQAFDIAKFCGIFAAIGMALGYIGGFLLKVWEGFMDLTWWQMPLSILALMLIISGPSMFIAWSKLRRRNLSPLLNANGWAVNTALPINIKFGASLTESAKYPLMKFDDPFADKKTPAWKKWLLGVAIVIVAAAATLYFTGKLQLCIEFVRSLFA